MPKQKTPAEAMNSPMPEELQDARAAITGMILAFIFQRAGEDDPALIFFAFGIIMTGLFFVRSLEWEMRRPNAARHTAPAS